MSMFHQLKNIFRSSSKLSSNPEEHKVHRKEAVERIVKEENIAKSKLPIYQGLEQYTLLKRLGEGAFSNVFEALDIKTSQHVAIKIVRKFELSQIQKASVWKEVQIMRTLSHPSIIKLLDFIETKDYFFLVLELMDGGEIFHQIVQLTYFSEDLARHCIKQVAEGIRYLHEERGVIHRDIKPENILFESISFMERKASPLPTQPEDEDEPKEDEGEFVPGIGGGCIGKVKIADFGLSKVVWDKHTMTPCGTVGYTAPEIVNDERYSKSVDMWALGCVLYTMLCGFPPFYDESIATLTQKVAKGQYTFLSPWWDHISVEAKHLVGHLLDVNPKKRYTIDQFLSHPWLKKQATPIAPTSPIPSTVDMSDEKESEATINNTSKNSPDLLVPPFTTTSVAAENISIAPTAPKAIPKSKRKDIFLSGISSMKEAFDVSYAVHRMGEERAKRKENKKLLQQQPHRQRLQAFNAPLPTLDDDNDDEDIMMTRDDDSNTSSSSSSDDTEEKYHQLQIESLCKTLDSQGALNNARFKESDKMIKKIPGTLREDGPPIVNQRVKPSFELNMNNATLLGRRKNTPLL